ncbi:hypothetical protein MVEG_08902 [Podila verticillata NRRL 6337]|nr:hypothetical protein MVEG_08902 [Podila verticillata NRRL 6337]
MTTSPSPSTVPACHKMNPSGGVGGIHAIHDAVALVNWMSTLRLADEEKLGKVFKKYRSERYPVAKAAFETSQMSMHYTGKNLLSVLVREMMKRIPEWAFKRIIYRMYASRPQASFLPLVEDNAPLKPSYQYSLHKTLVIHKELVKKATGLSTMSHAPVTV